MNQNHSQTDKYKLDYQTISTISKQYMICNNFIDLFNSKNYKGKRYMSNGRLIIKQPTQQGQENKYLIIDKDHTTRYLVEKIISYSSPQNTDRQFQNIITFQGYKMELNKYMIHGFFKHFIMDSYSQYFGFQYVESGAEGKGRQVLFCKINRNNKITKYYFESKLTCTRETQVSQQQSLSTDYFGQPILDSSLQNLNNEVPLSTNIINYFFKRLMFSYYSKFWYNRKLLLAKIFKSQTLASFFSCKQVQALNYEYFQNRFFKIYSGTHKNPFEQQELILFPIFQKLQDHFVLGVIKVDNKQKKLHIYELDPLDTLIGQSQSQRKSQTWRNNLQHIIEYTQRMVKQNNIPYPQYTHQYYPLVKYIQAPRQLPNSSDCGIYICLYALIIMQKFSLLNLDKEFKQICKNNDQNRHLIKYIRRYLFQSYKHRDMSFLDAFKNKFNNRFNLSSFK